MAIVEWILALFEPAPTWRDDNHDQQQEEEAAAKRVFDLCYRAHLARYNPAYFDVLKNGMTWSEVISDMSAYYNMPVPGNFDIVADRHVYDRIQAVLMTIENKSGNTRWIPPQERG